MYGAWDIVIAMLVIWVIISLSVVMGAVIATVWRR